MKSINFIHSVSPQEQRAITRWLYLSCLLFCTSVLIMGIIYFKQLNMLHNLKKEYARLEHASHQLQTVLTEKRSLKEFQQKLQDQTAKITRIKEKPKNPMALLHLFITTLPQEISLQSLSLQKKRLNVVLLGSSPNIILHYIKKLSGHPLFNQLEIQSIEPFDDNRTKVTFDAVMS